MAIEPWFLGAMAFGVSGYAVYLAGLQRHLVEPNRASWLIWSAATGVEAATYAAVNPGAPQAWIFAFAAIACIAVTLVMWRRSRWRTPTPVESVCMAAALAAILLWVVWRETFWAHMLVVAAVPVSFWPTWQSVWEDPARERSPAWGLWTFGDMATLLLATHTGTQSVGEYGYIFVELLCHASVWFMVGLTTLNPLRSFGFRRGGLFVLDAYRPAANLFTVGETHLGKAVYAAQGFAGGDTIIRFSGPRVSAARVPTPMRGRDDRFVQVSRDAYLGPSGRIDDLVNHSCAPNAGLRFEGDAVYLVAIRAIAPGEEIAWDYATTVSGSDWRMACACGAPECRGTIGAFTDMPAERQAWFCERGLVAPYLMPGDRVERAA